MSVDRYVIFVLLFFFTKNQNGPKFGYKKQLIFTRLKSDPVH